MMKKLNTILIISTLILTSFGAQANLQDDDSRKTGHTSHNASHALHNVNVERNEPSGPTTSVWYQWVPTLAPITISTMAAKHKQEAIAKAKARKKEKKDRRNRERKLRVRAEREYEHRHMPVKYRHNISSR